MTENDCIDLAKNDPAALIAAFATMKPTLLTFAAAHLGTYAAADVAVPALLPLLDHPKSYVREGAVYGLCGHMNADARVRPALLALLHHDPSEGVRTATQEVLEENDAEDPAA